MDTVFGIIGFVLGIILFLWILDRFQMLFFGFKSVIGLFIFCWVMGIIITWFAWKIAIVMGLVALIAFIISKKFKKDDTPTEKENHSSEQEDTKQESNGGNDNVNQ